MKFIDEAIIEVKAGDGGNGCLSFRREKYVPRGGPDGGDGGNGGSCILKAKAGITTLMDLKFRKHFEAKRGVHGKGKKMYGKAGDDVVIIVPIGTTIKEAKTGKVLVDLARAGQEFVVAKGGKGGRGNARFVSSTRQAPQIAEKGKEGEEKTIKLELKLLADVGLIGFPNAGKSTLIAAISNARPKIADYPFTTKVPHLGVVRLNTEKSFVVADIPGLIEGAHKGAGMGIQFLKHIERTKILLHLIDVIDPTQSDPLAAYRAIREELGAYQPALLEKPEIIVLTKMDMQKAFEQKKEMEKVFKNLGKPIFAISALKKEGLKPLLQEASKFLT
ncbi:MAG: GTPase ObgE [Deltaproteobacteria bacterium RIFCSPLOWO2_01_44_7]|nr:MAG: GTPase ObgE [Deltaproteobacteria bacterium RIFCSPHIGHO2_01_FULL_43_49]OGQ14785.1 MAG: GTPase ObgE [Deltaproteobacteria bacterium RIFCSPHIGHO2_02_FULL_44_53]OGQ28171.1 MAG: GTPase ObgE [Deltaproteobacteria bacterium RIFCSPHIGHO2_12_FULL_44_21]OGQ31383.1 MAG: GTPase ObgE [Deltaproteobacteria bacterium RIFCSPLOWO2_01_FULL_45_74]OGQ39061.1 MAG: GTPase ObgE [Deltaproteobacteria bacterium RIFCSPLOWO2_01_44_7]OGQ43375.1 MAG: GTPase ObgE [Deltaproteobacteria bacterium RIFCSPLOWO2_02_FULL_44_34